MYAVHRGGETAGASPGRLATNVNIGSRRGVWGNRVSPCPHPRAGVGGQSPPRSNLCSSHRGAARAAWTANMNIRSRRGDGETRFPHPPARGRVWEGKALEQGDGGTRFPHPPARGRFWEGKALPGSPLTGNGTIPVNTLVSSCFNGITSKHQYHHRCL